MKRYIAFVVLLLASFATYGQSKPVKELRTKLQQVTAGHKASIGIGIIHLENGDTLAINNNHRYPMQSVYKFPLAIMVLRMVDQGKLRLDKKVRVNKKDLEDNTWSPMKKEHPVGGYEMSIEQLLYYAVSLSDNIACDLLFRAAGGTGKVNNYIHGLGIKDIAIVATEHEMRAGWNVQYTNWCQPYAMTKLLQGFYKQQYLSEAGNRLLMKLMVESSNSAKRIKGMLPADVIVAHKTGTSDTNDKGMKAACNDIGIITLPNGKHIAITVFVSDLREKMEDDEKIIAVIGRTVYDFFVGR